MLTLLLLIPGVFDGIGSGWMKELLTRELSMMVILSRD